MEQSKIFEPFKILILVGSRLFASTATRKENWKLKPSWSSLWDITFWDVPPSLYIHVNTIWLKKGDRRPDLKKKENKLNCESGVQVLHSFLPKTKCCIAVKASNKLYVRLSCQLPSYILNGHWCGISRYLEPSGLWFSLHSLLMNLSIDSSIG